MAFRRTFDEFEEAGIMKLNRLFSTSKIAGVIAIFSIAACGANQDNNKDALDLAADNGAPAVRTTFDALDQAARAQAAMQAVAAKLPVSEVELQQSGANFWLSSDLVNATLPATAGDAIHVDFGGVPRDVRILGASAATAQGLQFAGNTVIYAGTDRSASTAATAAITDEGAVVEIHTIIHDETAPEVYRMSISLAPGERLEVVDDRVVKIFAEGGNPQATIDARWAQDAAGRDVPYALSVDGDQIVMTVRHQGGGFTYPIVADPAISVHCGWGFPVCSVWFSRATTRRMVTRGGVLWAIGSFCGSLPSWAHGACYALTGAAGLLAVKAGQCASSNQCLRVGILPPGPMFCNGGPDCSNR
jgi:hypothetical protein